MGLRVDSPDSVTATGYARDSSASDVLRSLSYDSMDNVVTEDRPESYYNDPYKIYKVTVTIEEV